MKQFTLRFRLKSTRNKTHPIEVAVGLSTKDEQGRYLFVYKSIGISLPSKEWDKNKGLPNDSKLAIKLLQLKEKLEDRLKMYQDFDDVMMNLSYTSGALTVDVQEEIDWVIYGKVSKFNERVNKVINEQSPRGFYVKWAIAKIRGAQYRLVDKNNNEIDMEKFLSLMDYPDEHYYINREEASMKAERLEKIVPYVGNSTEKDDSILFSEYIKEVAQKKMALPGKGHLDDDTPYVNLSKKFADWNNTITINQYNDVVGGQFLNWLKNKLNTINNYGKYVSRLKSVIYWAIDEDKVISPDKVRPASMLYSSEKEESLQPYLTEEQLLSLAKVEFKPDEQDLEYVRDLFIIGSYSGGLRFGNWEQMFAVQNREVDGEKIYFIESMSTKVGERKPIPLHDIAYNLLKKYEFKFQEIIDNDFNLKIKEVCARAGEIDKSFNQDFISYRKNLKTGKPEIIKLQRKGWEVARIPKFHELIASHSCRRSFATNMYFHRKQHASTVMQFTGHSKLEDFLLYCKAGERTKFDDFAKQVILVDRQKG